MELQEHILERKDQGWVVDGKVTPWKESAPAASVVTWLKTKEGGPTKFKIILGD